MKGRKGLFTIVIAFALALVITAGVFACNIKPDGSSSSGGASGDGELVVAELIIGTAPKRTTYYVGDRFDPTGMKVRAKWTDGITLPVDLSDCAIMPDGALKATDKEVIVSYGGKSAAQKITVADTEVASVSVDTNNIALKIPLNAKADFSGVTVRVKYADGNERVLEGGYSFKVDGAAIKDPSAISFSTSGKHVITVVYGEKSADIEVYVFSGFAVEAENILSASDVTEDSKNYVEIVKASPKGKPTAIRRDTEPASGGGYMGSVFNGSVIRFHVYAEADCYAEAILRASSANMLKDGGAWSPVEMGDQQFNRLFKVSYGSIAEANGDMLKTLDIADDVILKGGKTENASGDSMLYVNWMDVTFGTIPLKKGDNVVELNVITDYINVRKENVACNIDRLEVRYTEDYTSPATPVSLEIKTAPTKLEYIAGEKFDKTGLEVIATMSDGTKRTVENADVKVKPSGALTASDTKVILSWNGVSIEQSVKVNGKIISIEAENLISSPTEDDKNYVEAVRNGYVGKPSAKNTEAEGVAETSGGKYLSGLFGDKGKGGAVVRFHIYSETACKANIKLYVSSCNVKTKGSDGTSDWSPSEMADVIFNQIFAVRFGVKDSLSTLNVGDDVIVKGGKTDDGKTSMALWENWREINFGELELKAGDNILELENVNSTLKNLAGEIFGLNVDRLLVEIVG